MIQKVCAFVVKAGFRRTFLAALFAAFAAGCSLAPVERNPEAAGAAAPSMGAWLTLFDGSDLAHWTGLGTGVIPAGQWLIEGNTLHKVGGGYGGDLRTLERYRNFELCFEFRLSKAANSGVKYNVSAELSQRHGEPTAAIGFEFQVLDDVDHPDARKGTNGNRTVGSLYDILPAASSKPPVRPGRWHKGCVVANGNRVQHSLDGVPVLVFDVTSQTFAEHLAVSKFAEMDSFAERRSGYIVLQDHFDDVWYRNVRVRRLTASGF